MILKHSLCVGLVFYNLAPGPDGVSGRISILFFNLLVQLLMPFSYMSFYVANRCRTPCDFVMARYNLAIMMLYFLALTCDADF
jgi:hypothetical protein